MSKVDHANLTIAAAQLETYARQLLEAAGVPAPHAAIVAESLTAANLRAVDSHGVRLITDYVNAIEAGTMDPRSAGSLVSESGACAVYDGGRGLGQVVSLAATGIVIRLAREHGLGLVSVRESNHFGAAAFWAQRIAAAGMIGLAFTNASPSVAPWQARQARVGTNPICMALPGGEDLWLLDMATTTVALNRIWKAAEHGDATLPAGWAMDAEGAPTVDTQQALTGFPMPLGGYKGTGLALMVEILCGVLSGGAVATEVGGTRVAGRPMRTSHAFLAIDVARFQPLAEFTARMRRFRELIKSSTPAAGYDEVLMAGEPEWRAEAERRAHGVPVTAAVWDELAKLARRLGVEPPAVS